MSNSNKVSSAYVVRDPDNKENLIDYGLKKPIEELKKIVTGQSQNESGEWSSKKITGI